MQRFLSACVIFLDNRVRLPNFSTTIKLGTGCCGNKWRASCHYNRSGMFDGGFSLKVNERGRPPVHVMHWTHEFSFCLNTGQRKTTEPTKIPNQEGYILVHLRVQLSCRELTLTLQSKGRVLTSVTSCYQRNFEATRQLTNFFMIYHVLCSHTLFWTIVKSRGTVSF